MYYLSLYIGYMELNLFKGCSLRTKSQNYHSEVVKLFLYYHIFIDGLSLQLPYVRS